MPLDPVLAERVHLLNGIRNWENGGNPGIVARLQEWYTDPAPYVRPDVPTRDVPLTADGHPFRVRVYGSGGGASPCLIWVHGGGFFAGDLDMNEADSVAREVVGRASAVVVSVDYSLVPNVAYPVPHHQVQEALLWAIGNGDELGIDVDLVTLGGASAGGALSLSAARELFAHGGRGPCALVLAYPVTHHRFASDPRQDALLADLPPVLRYRPDSLAEIDDDYLGQHPHPRFAFVDLEPAGIRAALAGLPPTLLLISEYDDLRNSAELLFQQARENAWPVERRLCEGMVHGHLNRTPALAETDASIDAIARVVREGRIKPNEA